MSKIDDMLAKILVDPVTREPLITVQSKDQIISEIKNQSGQSYPIINGVIDFENDTNYADNFGDQWSRFPKLQLDSFNGTKISEKRFFGALKLEPDELKGKLVLDVGCGTGLSGNALRKFGFYQIDRKAKERR